MAEKVVPTISAQLGGREITITTVYSAPRDKVWRAYTEPELIIIDPVRCPIDRAVSSSSISPNRS